MKKNDRPFYPEYMRKKRPHPPRIFCRTLADWIFGIMSPSAVFHYKTNCPEKYVKQVIEYDRKSCEYLCWMRKLNRPGWKSLYRDYRMRKGNDHGPEGD